MVESLRITVLVENTAGRRGLLGEHGLAFWLECDGRRLLFDSGQGLALGHNAATLEIELATAEAVVLSHGHYDHVGGLAVERAHFADATAYVHPGAFVERYSTRGAVGAGSVAPPIPDRQTLEQWVAAVVPTEQPTTIAPGVWATGAIPRRTDYEDVGGDFYLDAGRTRRDPLEDDQALVVETSRGLVVILGCGHAGVINTLDYVSAQRGGSSLRAVVGGLHLVNANMRRIGATIAALREREPGLIAAGHCTGWQAELALGTAFGERYAPLCAGRTLVFD